MLSLWRVGQRERGRRSPQSKGLVRLGRRVSLNPWLLVTAHHMKECRSTEPAERQMPPNLLPLLGRGWQVDKAEREGG